MDNNSSKTRKYIIIAIIITSVSTLIGIYLILYLNKGCTTVKQVELEKNPISEDEMPKNHIKDFYEYKAKLQTGSFKDERDNVNTYKWIRLDDGKKWMVNNLNYDTDNSLCINENYCFEFGRKYDWNEAQTACPKGWRLPSDSDWNYIFSFYENASLTNFELQNPKKRELLPLKH